ncbi:hypothetical protein B0O99DRAFT_296032 [Bisporella sp. PMI_857]|nr:hypothetical protein B0O99DRAFT_296032 [Bisporella sp. PMI_857]
MSLTTSIPRFLLPQRSAIWRTRLPIPTTSTIVVRHASTKKKSNDGSKPLVLEKPTKFNPPSHGSRIKKAPRNYPGPNLTAEEAQIRKTKRYPNMMPAEGTFMHWFIHNRSIHLYICLGTLFSLALTVFITDFKNSSPFADMLPNWYDLFFHPIAFTQTWVEVIRLNTAHTTAETQERRRQKVEDVAKRSAYRKAHGLDKDEGFGGWMAKSDAESLGPAIPVGDVEGKIVAEGEVREGEIVRQKRPPVKKWLGIW